MEQSAREKLSTSKLVQAPQGLITRGRVKSSYADKYGMWGVFYILIYITFLYQHSSHYEL